MTNDCRGCVSGRHDPRSCYHCKHGQVDPCDLKTGPVYCVRSPGHCGSSVPFPSAKEGDCEDWVAEPADWEGSVVEMGNELLKLRQFLLDVKVARAGASWKMLQEAISRVEKA